MVLRTNAGADGWRLPTKPVKHTRSHGVSNVHAGIGARGGWRRRVCVDDQSSRAKKKVGVLKMLFHLRSKLVLQLLHDVAWICQVASWRWRFDAARDLSSCSRSVQGHVMCDPDSGR